MVLQNPLSVICVKRFLIAVINTEIVLVSELIYVKYLPNCCFFCYQVLFILCYDSFSFIYLHTHFLFFFFSTRDMCVSKGRKEGRKAGESQ